MVPVHRGLWYTKKSINLDEIMGVDEEVDVIVTDMRQEFFRTEDSIKKLQESDAFVFVYAVDDWMSCGAVRQLYEHVMNIHEEGKKFKKELCDKQGRVWINSGTPPIVLLANKCDLNKREVSTQHGVELARDLNCHFFETSTRTHVNVEDAFHVIIKHWIFNQQEEEKTKKGEKSESLATDPKDKYATKEEEAIALAYGQPYWVKQESRVQCLIL